jgi:hypothetical protein
LTVRPDVSTQKSVWDPAGPACASAHDTVPAGVTLPWSIEGCEQLKDMSHVIAAARTTRFTVRASLQRSA